MTTTYPDAITLEVTAEHLEAALAARNNGIPTAFCCPIQQALRPLYPPEGNFIVSVSHATARIRHIDDSLKADDQATHYLLNSAARDVVDMYEYNTLTRHELPMTVKLHRMP